MKILNAKFRIIQLASELMKVPRSIANGVSGKKQQYLLHCSPAGRDFRFATTSRGELDHKKVVCASLCSPY